MTTVVLAALLMAPPVTVQDRVFAKTDTWNLVAAGTILSRGDFYTSPGVGIAATRYLDEVLAVELQASYFFTYERQVARDVYAATGFVQDHAEPRGAAAVGARYAFGYGKLFIEAGGAVLHFVPELAAHAGVLVTSDRVAPALDVGLGVRILIAERFVGVVDYRLVFSAEPDIVVGQQPSIGIGIVL